MRIKKGFTLLEIVVALGIMGILMLPLANSLIQSVKANKMGEIVQESKQISQEIIENLRTIGDVKATNLKIGSLDETVQIKSVPGTDGKYTVDGTVNDITLTGKIEKTAKGGTLKYDSDIYREKMVGLVFYSYLDTKSSELNKNEILISYEKDGISIDEHIKSIENYIKTGSTPLNTKVEKLSDKNKISLEINKKSSIGADGSTHVITIDDTYFNGTHLDGTKKDIDLKNIDIGIIVKDIRTGKTDGSSPFMGLNIESKLIEKSNLYFFNNKFEAGEKKEGINDNVAKGVIVDSFDKDRYISEKVDVKDNVKFIESVDMTNKGLYTITLETERNDVKEKTISEFIVSN
ncbi:MAG: type II secretion system protein [Sarcina sp.]